MKITIIGNGRFGTYLASQLELVSLHPKLLGETNPKTVEGSDVVIFCVPIRAFQDCFASYAPFFKPGTTVMDTCSVKSHPCKVMHNTPGIRMGVNLVGCHPLFGPQSAPISCAGQKTAICPLQGDFGPAVELWEKTLKTTPVLCTPKQHDKQMGTQLLNHFIGRSGQAANIRRVELSTKTHELFMDIQDIVCGNSRELFEDLNVFNPYAKAAREHFLKEAQLLHKKLSHLQP